MVEAQHDANLASEVQASAHERHEDAFPLVGEVLSVVEHGLLARRDGRVSVLVSLQKLVVSELSAPVNAVLDVLDSNDQRRHEKVAEGVQELRCDATHSHHSEQVGSHGETDGGDEGESHPLEVLTC